MCMRTASKKTPTDCSRNVLPWSSHSSSSSVCNFARSCSIFLSLFRPNVPNPRPLSSLLPLFSSFSVNVERQSWSGSCRTWKWSVFWFRFKFFGNKNLSLFSIKRSKNYVVPTKTSNFAQKYSSFAWAYKAFLLATNSPIMNILRIAWKASWARFFSHLRIKIRQSYYITSFLNNYHWGKTIPLYLLNSLFPKPGKNRDGTVVFHYTTARTESTVRSPLGKTFFFMIRFDGKLIMTCLARQELKSLSACFSSNPCQSIATFFGKKRSHSGYKQVPRLHLETSIIFYKVTFFTKYHEFAKNKKYQPRNIPHDCWYQSWNIQRP